MHDSSVGDTSVKLCTDYLHMTLIDNQPLATQNSKMARPKIQDVRPKIWFFLYNFKCVYFKPHKCIEVEYKVGHSGYFGTKDMSVSITVHEIQYTGKCFKCTSAHG